MNNIIIDKDAEKKNTLEYVVSVVANNIVIIYQGI